MVPQRRQERNEFSHALHKVANNSSGMKGPIIGKHTLHKKSYSKGGNEHRGLNDSKHDITAMYVAAALESNNSIISR